MYVKKQIGLGHYFFLLLTMMQSFPNDKLDLQKLKMMPPHKHTHTHTKKSLKFSYQRFEYFAEVTNNDSS